LIRAEACPVKATATISAVINDVPTILRCILQIPS